jgi:hypothetical protein
MGKKGLICKNVQKVVVVIYIVKVFDIVIIVTETGPVLKFITTDIS